MRVLIVEDEDRIADFLQRALKSEGHTCVRCADGNEAFTLGRMGEFDVILLDLMLPGMPGLDVCQNLRFRKVQTPIIMLTALDAIEDVVQGLNMGADDYMTKPIDLDELLARMAAVVRRWGIEPEAPGTLDVGGVSLNRESMSVSVDGVRVDLTAKELALLELLMSFPQKLFSRERILNTVWGISTDPLTNVVDVYIGRLRKKLGRDGSPFIETVRGMGYRIDPELL
ncbi:MAG: response regulator transcription factor [Pseudomonadota bacterium]